ncbi:MAG: DUF1330 domain-containing protein [Pseudomonadota bacterium]
MRGFLIGIVIGVGLGIAGTFFALSPEQPANQSVAVATPPPADPTSGPSPSERPAYMLVLGEVTDRAAFGQGYAVKLPPLYDRFGGRYLAVGGGVDVLEGSYAPKSFVIGQWPSKSAALEFWNSPEYDVLRRARIDGGWGDFDVLLVEGLPTPSIAAPVTVEQQE